MLAAMYLRKSRSEEQVPVTVILARHRDALTQFAKANKITIAAIYEEVASGDSLYGRPEMLRLLSDIDKVDAILCMDIDRLGRGAMHEQGLILEAIRSADVRIVTPSKTYDLNDDMDDSLISFKALFAREEYKIIRGRLKRGVLKTIQDGGYVANAPYGYRKARENKRPTLIIDEQEATAIQLIFNQYEKGNGAQTIANLLHSLGYRPHRGEKFSRSSVLKILRNPVYTGKVVWNQCTFKRPKRQGEKHTRTLNPENEWLIIDGIHKPIISEQQFQHVNTLLNGKYHPPYRKPDEIKNPLSGILFCANCGRAMSRQPLYNKPYNQPMILCATTGCCMSSAQNVVEQAVFATLQAMLYQLKTYEQEVNDTPYIDYDAIANVAKAEIKRLQGQLGSLHDLLEQGVYDVDTFLARRDEIDARIRAAEKTMASTVRLPEHNIIAYKLESVLSAYWDGTPLERNELLKSVIGNMMYSKPKGSGWKALPDIRFISWAKNL